MKRFFGLRDYSILSKVSQELHCFEIKNNLFSRLIFIELFTIRVSCYLTRPLVFMWNVEWKSVNREIYWYSRCVLVFLINLFIFSCRNMLQFLDRKLYTWFISVIMHELCDTSVLSYLEKLWFFNIGIKTCFLYSIVVCHYFFFLNSYGCLNFFFNLNMFK